MKSGSCLAMTITVLFAVVLHATPARTDPEICERLREVSSVKPAKSELYKILPLEEVCRSLYWTHFHPLPLSKIMNKDEIAEYLRNISTGDCTAAVALLGNRFAATYSESPSILTNRLNYKNWMSNTVGKHYPKLGLCFDLEQIRIAQEKIDALGLQAAPYAGVQNSMDARARNEFSKPARKRNLAIFNMHANLRSSFSPDIALALLKLSLEGRAVKYHEKYELYLAYWLDEKGLSDPIIQHVINRPYAERLRSDMRSRAQREQFVFFPDYPE